MPNSRLKNILTSAGWFSVLSLLPKVIVIAKDSAVAYYFGASANLDTYLMAFVLIGTPASIIIIALHTTLVPALTGRDEKSFAGLLGSVLMLASVCLAALLPLWLHAIPKILNFVYPDKSEENLSSLNSACFWLIPYYFFSGINILLDGALQARKIFWPNAIFSGFFPASILAILLLWGTSDIRILLIGTILGSLFQFIALLRIVSKKCGISLPNINSIDLRIFFCATPLMLSGLLNGISQLFEKSITFNLGPSAISILTYGNKVPAATLTFMVTAIGIVVFPHFSELLNNQKNQDCFFLHSKLSLILTACGVLVATCGILFSKQIIQFLFERGAFTENDSVGASRVMNAYFLQLPFQLAAIISQTTLAAMGKVTKIALAAIIQLITSCLLSFYLSKQFGVTGVVIGSGIGVALSAGVLFWAVRNSFKNQLCHKMP